MSIELWVRFCFSLLIWSMLESGRPANIEILAVEVFHEIFSFFSAEEIRRTFFKLNRRIDSSIESSTRIRLVLDENWDRTQVDRPTNFDVFVRILIVQHDEPVDFARFRRVRSLTLKKPTKTQIETLEKVDLPLIEELKIENFYFPSSMDVFNRFFHSKVFSQIRRFRIDRFDSRVFDEKSFFSEVKVFQSFPSNLSPNFFSSIVGSSKNLSEVNFFNVEQISVPIRSNFCAPIPTVRVFKVHFQFFDKFQIEKMKNFLEIFPSINKFSVFIEEIRFETENFLLRSLVSILQQFSPFLTDFRLKLIRNEFFQISKFRIDDFRRIFRKTFLQSNRQIVLLIASKWFFFFQLKTKKRKNSVWQKYFLLFLLGFGLIFFRIEAALYRRKIEICSRVTTINVQNIETRRFEMRRCVVRTRDENLKKQSVFVEQNSFMKTFRFTLLFSPSSVGS